MLKYIVIIILIFAVIILGQQPFFQQTGKQAYQKISGWGSDVWQKCKDYWNKNIMGRVTSEIEKRQDIVKDEIANQTQAVGQTIWQKISSYFSRVFNSVMGK